MKNFRTVLIICILCLSNKGIAQDSTIAVKRAWYIPEYAKVQFAGNIGFLATGVGYHFFNKKLYTELLYGHVPRRISKADKIRTITIKNTFPLYRYQFKEYSLSPITGFTASVETGNNSFIELPTKFPEDYYSTNAFHATLFMGGMVHRDFKNKKRLKGIDFYYEIGTVATYFWYNISQKGVSIKDTFSSAIGFNFYF